MNVNIHPVLKEMLAFGCNDKRIAPAAFAVFMDLSEVKAVWDLQYQYSESLNIIYLTGKENENDVKTNVYLPLPASFTVSPAWLQEAQRCLPTNNQGIVLAFKDADSTVVYYHLTEGLITPDSPEVVQQRKASEERKRLMQNELWRKRNQLHEMAKSNSNTKSSNEDSNSTNI